MTFVRGAFSTSFVIFVCWSSGFTNALPDVFTATISGMDCSLYLITQEGGTLNTKKSEVNCETDQKVSVESAIVINDDTDRIFELNLSARAKKTKLIRGKLLPNPQDMNLASKYIQHQGPSSDKVDLDELVQMLKRGKQLTIKKKEISVNCTYQQPGAVDWSPCQTNGIRLKVLRLIKRKSSRGCFKYRTMSDKCEGGSRGYRKLSSQTSRTSVPEDEDMENTKIETNAVIISGFQIKFPVEDNTTIVDNEIDITTADNVSSGVIVEGDILTFPTSVKQNKNAVWNRPWPNNELIYEFDASMTGNQRYYVRYALAVLTSKLGQCVRFVHRRWGKRVKVTSRPDGGCHSAVGYYHYKPWTNLNLGYTCFSTGIIQHEFLHAIGLHHAQNRNDRDTYVTYYKDNVCCPKPTWACYPNRCCTTRECTSCRCETYNFDTCRNQGEYCSHYGLGYDYLSLMHYKKDAYRNGKGDTIVPKDSFWTDKIGQSMEVSFGDVQLVQRLYGCPVALQWKGSRGNFPSSPELCPSGSFVYGYRLLSEEDQGQSGDNTGLNAIRLSCRKPNSHKETKKIYSSRGFWGSWGSVAWCNGNNNPVIGFDVKEEGGQGPGGDTALNAVDLYCKNGGYASASVNSYRGGWKPMQMCPSGFAVTGIRTQVEGKQGGSHDDTALNGLELYCEKYP